MGIPVGGNLEYADEVTLYPRLGGQKRNLKGLPEASDPNPIQDSILLGFYGALPAPNPVVPI